MRDDELQEKDALEETGKKLIGQIPRNEISLRPRLWKK